MNNNLRAIEVEYEDGTKYTTSMAINLTDKEMLDYFAIGKWFNVGSVNDNMQKVKSRQIIK